MKLSTIDSGFFKLDGGAMFGVVPKSLWSRKYPSDQANMIPLAMRSILIELGNRKILVDTGLGNKQPEKWQSFFYPSGPDASESLLISGYKVEQITDVILTHLHFDHVGGALYMDNTGKFQPTFPEAKYWICDKHYDWAIDPNPREKPSFLKENFTPLKDLGRVNWINYEQDGFMFDQGINIHFANGHTEAMMILEVVSEDQNYFYPADLIPTHCHISDSYVMSYDVRPLITMSEKRDFLDQVYEKNGVIVFEHDSDMPMVKIAQNEMGNYIISDLNRSH
jgi:glyoxylase-like metal-dependent hydrolase (beta-lactamase superfamily II)